MTQLDRYTANVHTSRHRKAQDEYKRRCHRCRGTGQAPCQICAGSGEVLKGKTYNGGPIFMRCQGCFGRKVNRCNVCCGEGFS